jgi:hypothetical protein
MPFFNTHINRGIQWFEIFLCKNYLQLVSNIFNCLLPFAGVRCSESRKQFFCNYCCHGSNDENPPSVFFRFHPTDIIDRSNRFKYAKNLIQCFFASPVRNGSTVGVTMRNGQSRGLPLLSSLIVG